MNLLYRNVCILTISLLIGGCVTYEGVVFKNETQSTQVFEVKEGIVGKQRYTIPPGETLFVGQRRGSVMNAITEVRLITGDKDIMEKQANNIGIVE